MVTYCQRSGILWALLVGLQLPLAGASSASFPVMSVGGHTNGATPTRRIHSALTSSRHSGSGDAICLPAHSLQRRGDSSTYRYDLDFLSTAHSHSSSSNAPHSVAIPCRSIGNTLLRGALLRIASDISGGTPLEGIKTRVTLTTEGPFEATRNMIRQGGVGALWTGTSSRTVEGALIGAVFMLGSVLTKTQFKKMGASPTVSALAGGLVGGVAQAVIMTPAGLIFTALNNQKNGNKQKQETAWGVVSRVVSEKGVAGMFAGGKPMCIRQATNWASRSGFTEIARSTLRLNEYGLVGEIAAGAIGGVGSCWNTPIETIRVYTQRDVSQGKEPKKMGQYWNEVVQENGYPGLFRGVTPRAVQAIWQTVFLVVVPNLMGI